MFKFLSKVAEKYAKVTNTSCFIYWVLHQPILSEIMIKKD